MIYVEKIIVADPWCRKVIKARSPYHRMTLSVIEHGVSHRTRFPNLRRKGVTRKIKKKTSERVMVGESKLTSASGPVAQATAGSTVDLDDDASTACPSDNDATLFDLQDEIEEVLEEQCSGLRIPDTDRMAEASAKAGKAKKKKENYNKRVAKEESKAVSSAFSKD